MKIRPAREGDVDALASVHVKSWQSSYRDIISADYLASLSIDYHAERWREFLRKQNTKSCIFVAENKDEQIVGFASGGRQSDPQLNYDGELYAIYLLQIAQRRGLGTRLTYSVANHLAMNGLESMLVWVLEDNPSRQFYEALNGKYVSEKTIVIGKQKLLEVAYGWKNLHDLLKSNAQ